MEAGGTYSTGMLTCYRPQTKLRKDNVFTPVCQSFCSWGGMCGRGECVAGGVHGREHVCQGGCMVEGMHGRGACVVEGHVWQGAYMAEGMHGRGACMVGEGMCGRGHVW